jgi:hypothetical protein
MTTDATRRRLLAGAATGGAFGLGGCVALSPALDRRFDDSPVFERIAGSERWAALRLRVTVTLTERATTELNVRGVVVVDESGSRYLRTDVEGGQTELVTYVPLEQEVTVAAVDGLARTVDTVTFATRL